MSPTGVNANSWVTDEKRHALGHAFFVID